MPGRSLAALQPLGHFGELGTAALPGSRQQLLAASCAVGLGRRALLGAQQLMRRRAMQGDELMALLNESPSAGLNIYLDNCQAIQASSVLFCLFICFSFVFVFLAIQASKRCALHSGKPLSTQLYSEQIEGSAGAPASAASAPVQAAAGLCAAAAVEGTAGGRSGRSGRSGPGARGH